MRTTTLITAALLAVLGGCGVQNPPTGPFTEAGPITVPAGGSITIVEQTEPTLTQATFTISDPVETSLPYGGGDRGTRTTPRFLTVGIAVWTRAGEFDFESASFTLVTAAGTTIHPVEAVKPNTLAQGRDPDGEKTLTGQIAFEITETATGGRIELHPHHYPNDTRVYVWTLGETRGTPDGTPGSVPAQ